MPRVLIIEDDAENRRVMAQFFTREHWNVLEAEDGDAGVELALRNRPELILCDLLMPKSNGFEVCRSIREQLQPTKIIVVSGRDQLGELAHSFNQMTENLERLLVVAKEKERLQSEIEIAREVQMQVGRVPAGRADVARALKLDVIITAWYPRQPFLQPVATRGGNGHGCCCSRYRHCPPPIMPIRKCSRPSVCCECS